MLKGVVPFVLMTATFSQTMIIRLAELLDAEPVTLTEVEIDALPSQHAKQRRYLFHDHELRAEAVIEPFLAHNQQRTIAICNTVARAQQLATDLRADPRLADVRIELLHSRFYASDRAKKEERIRQEFGEGAAQSQRVILVATQVVEVGLNITCEMLHTELAPAAALIQRAGRCARFANESGEVRIYAAPLTDKGEPDYAPYLEEGQRGLCERTRDALLAQMPPEGRVLRYHDELALVNTAHEPYDIQLLDTLNQRRHDLQQAIAEALSTQQRNLARRLIRDISSRTVIVHADPNESTVPNPYRYEGLSLSPGALSRWCGEVQQRAWDLGLDWIAKIARSEETTNLAEDPEQRRRIETNWKHVLQPSTNEEDVRAQKADLWSSGYIVALNPALVQYDSNSGFQLIPGTVPASESPAANLKRGRDEGGPIERETYAEHIAGLYRVYLQRQRDRTAAVRRRLEQRFGLAEGSMDRAIRLMFAVHDLGKLDEQWQTWAHRWQAKVVQIR